MCMVRTSDCLVAEEDITCYKVCRKDSYIIGNVAAYSSWFQNYPYALGQFMNAASPKNFIGTCERTELRKGGFHSYVEIDTLIEELQKAKLPDPAYVLECKIPRGSLYYTGLDDAFYLPNYLSSDIIIIKEIKFNFKMRLWLLKKRIFG